MRGARAVSTDSDEGGLRQDAASVLLPGMRLLVHMMTAETGVALTLVLFQVPSDLGTPQGPVNSTDKPKKDTLEMS